MPPASVQLPATVVAETNCTSALRPLASPGTKLVSVESHATNRPSSLMAGEVLVQHQARGACRDQADSFCGPSLSISQESACFRRFLRRDTPRY